MADGLLWEELEDMKLIDFFENLFFSLTAIAEGF